VRHPISVGSLSKEALAAVEARYERTKDAEERTRCQIVLLSDEGLSPPRIAEIVRRSVQGVRLIIHRYRDEGLHGLKDARHTNPGRERATTAEWEEELLEAIEQDPRRLGASRANWSATLLAEYLARRTGVRVGEERVRHYLHRHGYAYLRPTWTVAHKAREDPDYEAKKG
jgi:transposase